MGIVAKQSIKNLISTYFGFGIGALNVLFLYPKFLSVEYYGLVTFLLSAGNLFWPFMALGVHNTIVKFYTSYHTKTDTDKLLNFALFMPLALGLLIGVAGFIFYDALLQYFEGENDLVQPYIWGIFVIAMATAYFEVFFAWVKVQFKSVFGTLMREVFHRLAITFLLIILYAELISVHLFIYLLIGVFILRTLVMLGYAFKLYLPKFSFQLPGRLKELMNYSLLIFIAGTVAVALFDLDKVMIEYFMPIENVSIYGIAIYIATVIAVPSKAMHQITNPITAKYLNHGESELLKDLYVRSSNTLFLISGFVFILIITNVHQLYEIIPEPYRIGVSIVFLISLVKLSDNVLGNNNSIIFNSKYYKTVLIAGVVLVGVAFLLNVWLIPIYGIYGAAYATFISFLAYNIFKLSFVRITFGIHPFNKRSLYIFLVITGLTLSFYFWDFTTEFALLNIVLKSILISILYFIISFKGALSKDLTNFYAKVIIKKSP
ncbi:oligosaccharide flippase family protein [Psychroflexus sediminis]|uniref:Membrane protein involved in the export of O-antigen and teichoic acid n=1 Tax=Psychroflexus sediminis TaxID=470826 RepID=A0A1G7WUQ8_9FLAO|nr:oligosaccharide flippase family protein [Psychroflexus sediminis]SDG75677.1 Membrane protein involved in the export of O-antigen and teichoic acid [Psychroflexus sediminis]